MPEMRYCSGGESATSRYNGHSTDGHARQKSIIYDSLLDKGHCLCRPHARDDDGGSIYPWAHTVMSLPAECRSASTCAAHPAPIPSSARALACSPACAGAFPPPPPISGATLATAPCRPTRSTPPTHACQTWLSWAVRPKPCRTHGPCQCEKRHFATTSTRGFDHARAFRGICEIAHFRGSAGQRAPATGLIAALAQVLDGLTGR